MKETALGPLGQIRRQLAFAPLVLAVTVATTATSFAENKPDEASKNGEDTFEILTTAWPGPYGGLPPVDRVTPAALEVAYRKAIELKRAEIRAIATNPAPATFENTVAALDASGTALLRIQRLLQIFTSTASNPEIAGVAERVLPLTAALEDEIAFDDALFARIKTIRDALPASAPTAEARRLVTVIYDDLLWRGAGLRESERDQVKKINARLAALISQFGQNLFREEETLVIWVDDVAEFKGLRSDRVDIAKEAARKRGKPDQWAIPMQRPSVWPVLTDADSRSLRERVFKLWESRGNNRGEFDNAPVMQEILKRRGEKAQLMGYSSYAQLATAARMAESPEVASAMLNRAWNVLLPQTRDEIDEMKRIADSEGKDFKIAPWDRLYYAEKLRQQKFGFDSNGVRPYLALQNILDGMMWAAQATYGLDFRELRNQPVVAPEIRVYEVIRDKRVIGVLYIDIYQRAGKGPASWAAEHRPAERGQPEVLPVVALHSNVVRPADGSPPLLAWEVANVIFHEFGHALHMLSNSASYRALGPLRVPFDFIETPSLLNERWLRDHKVLTRFARHFETGEPMPPELIGKLEKTLRHDRVFSMTLDFLATAITDMRLHLMADGRPIDPVAEEQKVLAEIGMPTAVTPLLRVSNAFHTFTEAYGAGVYTYLWSDAIAADIAEAFLASPGGLFDAEVAARYRRNILDAGNTRPMSEAFREFRGRDPDPDALFRRFDLLTGN